MIQALLSVEGDPSFRPAEFHHITGAGNTKRRGKDVHVPGDQQVAPSLFLPGIMGLFVHDRSVGGPPIFRPLVFNVDQRPLPAAELEMLEPGELEVVLLWIDHPIRVTVMPAGRADSSTVTV